MTSFRTEIEQVKVHLLRGDLGAAEAHLTDVPAASIAEKRMSQHYRGMIFMRQGLYQEAIDLFLKTLDDQGNHICMLIDLAACYYMRGQIQSWLRTLDLTENEFRRVESQISPEMKLDFLLTLGKFREEQGALFEAKEIYAQNIAVLEPLQKSTEARIDYIRNLAQILRLQGQYADTSRGHDYYLQLIHHASIDTNWDCAFEVEHALMIFEAKCFGVDSGLLRFRKLAGNPLCSSQEAALVLSDLVYELLLCRREVPPEILSYLSQMKNLSPFEDAILSFAQGRIPTYEEMLTWPEKMAPSAHMRLLVLAARMTASETLQKKLIFLIKNFSQKTIQMWLSTFEKDLPQNAPNSILYQREQLVYGNEVLSLKNKSAYREIVELVVEHKNIEISEAIRILWQGEGMDYDISRLRMRVRRLNAEIERAWGLRDFVTMKQSRLSSTFAIHKM